jgi:hypothetical protein
VWYRRCVRTRLPQFRYSQSNPANAVRDYMISADTACVACQVQCATCQYVVQTVLINAGQYTSLVHNYCIMCANPKAWQCKTRSKCPRMPCNRPHPTTASHSLCACSLQVLAIRHPMAHREPHCCPACLQRTAPVSFQPTHRPGNPVGCAQTGRYLILHSAA